MTEPARRAATTIASYPIFEVVVMAVTNPGGRQLNVDAAGVSGEHRVAQLAQPLQLALGVDGGD